MCRIAVHELCPALRQKGKNFFLQLDANSNAAAMCEEGGQAVKSAFVGGEQRVTCPGCAQNNSGFPTMEIPRGS